MSFIVTCHYHLVQSKEGIYASTLKLSIYELRDMDLFLMVKKSFCYEIGLNYLKDNRV